MSCGCDDPYNGDSAYTGLCNTDTPYPSISAESVPSLIANLVSSLYGQITKDASSGKVVWNIPCDPNSAAQIGNIPRYSGEGLLCYIMRALTIPFETSGMVRLTSGSTITTDLLGKFINVVGNGSNTGTITLPPLTVNSVANRYFPITIFNGGTDKVIVTANTGNTIRAKNGTSATTFTLSANDSTVLTPFDDVTQTVWVSTLGTATLSASSQFSASLTPAGYTFLPSGVCIQWGGANCPSGASQVNYFPTAFKTSSVAVLMQNANIGAVASSIATNGFTSTSTGSTVFSNYLAIGY
jgi:hypothetical protein